MTHGSDSCYCKSEVSGGLEQITCIRERLLKVREALLHCDRCCNVVSHGPDKDCITPQHHKDAVLSEPTSSSVSTMAPTEEDDSWSFGSLDWTPRGDAESRTHACQNEEQREEQIQVERQLFAQLNHASHNRLSCIRSHEDLARYLGREDGPKQWMQQHGMHNLRKYIHGH
mmetsp:Transcript_56716/g.90199  ORF Transcript_56716/g.90199 Transcript_56716/m.90199 type:complete len:171 (+) Transcript_56716:54-566(+)